MKIRIPDPPVPFNKQKLNLTQIAARWKIPATYVRLRLEKAGVKFVKVERPPVDGVLLTDLLAFEARVRAEQKTEVTP
jgi:hypothetical protein